MPREAGRDALGVLRRGTGVRSVHEVGIPSSGLYVVVAVVNQRARRQNLLEELIGQTRFGDDAIRRLRRVARPAQTA